MRTLAAVFIARFLDAAIALASFLLLVRVLLLDKILLWSNLLFCSWILVWIISLLASKRGNILPWVLRFGSLTLLLSFLIGKGLNAEIEAQAYLFLFASSVALLLAIYGLLFVLSFRYRPSGGEQI